MLSSLCMSSQNISCYWIGCFRRLVLAPSLQALKLAEEVISESCRNVTEMPFFSFFFLKVHMRTFNLFCLQPFQQMMTPCRELFSLDATGANRKQLKTNSTEAHTISTSLFQSMQPSRKQVLSSTTVTTDT